MTRNPAVTLIVLFFATITAALLVLLADASTPAALAATALTITGAAMLRTDRG